MGIFLNGVGANSFKVTVAGTDLTDHVKSVTINQEYDDVDVTAMGATAKAHMPGLRDDSLDIEFFQDFAASKVDATLNTLLGSATGSTVVVIAGGTTASATTPSYTLIGSPYTYNPIDGSVGEASMTKVTFKPAPGQSIVRATA
jgi:hypothetical protein